MDGLDLLGVENECVEKRSHSIWPTVLVLGLAGIGVVWVLNQKPAEKSKALHFSPPKKHWSQLPVSVYPHAPYPKKAEVVRPVRVSAKEAEPSFWDDFSEIPTWKERIV